MDKLAPALNVTGPRGDRGSVLEREAITGVDGDVHASGVVPAPARRDARRTARESRALLLLELAAIRGVALAATFDPEGVCLALHRTQQICAFATYRILTEVSSSAPGRSVMAFDVDGRAVFVRRLFDGGYAMVSTTSSTDAYAAEVLLMEAAAGHVLRAGSTVEAPRSRPLSTMTIPPPAGNSPSELPPLEASLVLAVGSLATVYRDLAAEFDDFDPSERTETIAC